MRLCRYVSIHRLVVAAAVAALSVIVTATPSAAAETSGPDASLARVLQRVVHNGRVDYLALLNDHAELDIYIAKIARTNPAELESDSHRLAFWLNTYNAVVLDAVLDNWPIASVRDVPGFFSKRSHRVAGQDMSLQEILNDKLRGGFSDPRVLFATVWACIGCAPLRSEPYSGPNVGEQLDEVVTAALRDERYMRVNTSAAVIYIPEFMKWYETDFRDVYGSPVEFAKKFCPEKFSGFDDGTNPFAVSYTRFDWNINIAKLPER